MASATVTLKYGKSYTCSHGSDVLRFTENPMRVTGASLIGKLKTISQLQVDEDVDAPVIPLKSAKPQPKPLGRANKLSTPPPQPEPEAEPELDEEPEEVQDADDDADPEATDGDGEPVDGDADGEDGGGVSGEEPETTAPKVNKGQFVKGAKPGAKKGA